MVSMRWARCAGVSGALPGAYHGGGSASATLKSATMRCVIRLSVRGLAVLAEELAQEAVELRAGFGGALLGDRGVLVPVYFDVGGGAELLERSFSSARK